MLNTGPNCVPLYWANRRPLRKVNRKGGGGGIGGAQICLKRIYEKITNFLLTLLRMCPAISSIFYKSFSVFSPLTVFVFFDPDSILAALRQISTADALLTF